MEDNFDISLLKKKKKINSRTKGNTFERKICGLLNEALNTTEFSRSPGSGAFATTHSLPKHLSLQGDILTPQDFPYMIECKKGYNKVGVNDLLDPSGVIISFFKKAEEQAGIVGKVPMLVFQQDRKDILCLVDSEHFPKKKGYYEEEELSPKSYIELVFELPNGRLKFLCVFKFSEYLEFIKKA